MTDTHRTITALLARRERSVAAGLSDEVADIDLRLRILGYAHAETATVEPQVETAVRKKPLRRKRD